MALDEYRRKRAVGKTPEPFGSVSVQALPPTMGAGTFVVQKHSARRLHYDFRLELGGVLVSWAVPKGPSLDPSIKRLAVQVEDHPVEYADFEGIIPAGNYGAGAVIVWDRGAWRPVEDPIAGLKKGHLVFELHGYKLHGVWNLIRTQGSEKEWLLIKKPDAWAASEGQRLLPPQSVLSGLELEDVGAAPQRAAEIGAELKKLGAKPHVVDGASVRVMLAETAERAFSDPGWLFELKYDGYRLVCERRNARVTLRYRSGLDATHLFPDLVRALEVLPFSFVADGEVVVVDSDGAPRFQELQKRVQLSSAAEIARAAVERPATFYLFDLLGFEEWDLRPLPLIQRKTVLQSILPRLGPLRFADHVEGEGAALFEEVRRRGLEGIMAKRADSPYRAGRSRAWLKLKSDQTGDFAIVGFSPPDKVSRSGFRALQLALRDGEKWIHVGAVGTGFSETELVKLRARLDELVVPKRPVEKVKPLTPRNVKWVRPELACEVRYAHFTDDGSLRHPVFVRMREDKPVRDCVIPHEEEAPATPEEEPAPPPPAAAAERKVPFSNLDKIFWPAEKYTKSDSIEYYRAIAPWLLPYLADRPVVLTRYPDGIDGKSFYQHNAPKFIPGWLRTERFWDEESGKEIDPIEHPRGHSPRGDGSARSARLIDYLILEDLESLLYAANLGTIPLHVWSSRAASIQTPDWCIVDLDPKGAPFSHVVKLARRLHALCDEIGLPSHCKTSGQSGLHVLVPLGRQCTHEQSRQLGHLLARVVAEAEPEIATVARPLSERGGRVYLDFMQNGHGRTLVAPFSLRPIAGAQASAPLLWKEVTEKLDPSRFTLATLPKRMDKLGADPLLPVLTEAPDLHAALDALGKKLRPDKKRS